MVIVIVIVIVVVIIIIIIIIARARQIVIVIVTMICVHHSLFAERQKRETVRNSNSDSNINSIGSSRSA